MSATPKTIINARKTTAPKIPQNNTRCWYLAGILNELKITAITKTLSMLNESSKIYPVKYVIQASPGESPVELGTSPSLNSQYTTPEKASAKPTQTLVHFTASLVPITWSSLLKTPRSNAKHIIISKIKETQTIID